MTGFGRTITWNSEHCSFPHMAQVLQLEQA